MWSVCVFLYINFDKQWDEEYNDLLSSLSFVFAARLGTTILLQKLYSFFKTFFSNCYFQGNIWKSHQNSEKRLWRKVLEKGNKKNRCNLVPSSEWLFNLIFVSFLMTTESNGRNLNCRYHTKLLLWINNIVYSILPTYFTLKKISVPNILKQ